MKLVFLDVDGVLNSHPFYERRHVLGQRQEARLVHHVDPLAVARLNNLCSKTRAKLVISSTWRLFYRSIPRMREEFQHAGIRATIIGRTPEIPGLDRGHEIQRWLDFHPPAPSSFVIVDDDPAMAHLTPRLVRTSMDTGLLDEHIARALELLSDGT